MGGYAHQRLAAARQGARHWMRIQDRSRTDTVATKACPAPHPDARSLSAPSTYERGVTDRPPTAENRRARDTKNRPKPCRKHNFNRKGIGRKTMEPPQRDIERGKESPPFIANATKGQAHATHEGPYDIFQLLPKRQTTRLARSRATVCNFHGGRDERGNRATQTVVALNRMATTLSERGRETPIEATKASLEL